MRKRPRLRRSVVSLLLTCGLTLVMVGILLSYTAHVVFGRRSFADRVARSAREPAVAILLADRISGAVTASRRDLTAYRPLVFYGARQVVASGAFTSLIRASAATLHFVVASRGGKDLLLNIADGGVLLKSALPMLPPTLAARIPDDITVGLGDEGTSKRLAHMVAWLPDAAAVAARSWWIFGGGVLLLIVAALLSPTPSRVGRETGWMLILTGVLLLALREAGDVLLEAVIDTDRVADAAAQIWSTFLYDALSWALVIAGLGVALLSPSIDLQRCGHTTWRWLTTVPESTPRRLAHAAGFVVAGYAFVTWPAPVVELAVVLLGVLLLFVGVTGIGNLVFRYDHAESVTKGALRPVVLVLAAALALAGGAVWVYLQVRSVVATARVTDACNGDRMLCGRPLDTVVFPTTHNSMASADQPTWFFPAQEANIPAQLRDGIRGFQIDAHYGQRVGNRVLTVLHDEGQARRTYEAEIGKEGVDAAFRIRNRLLGQPRGAKRLYLCHGFCEIGSQDLVTVLGSMRDFLRRNPREVLILVIQDEDVDPADFARATEDSGLIAYVYRGPVTGPWPTLEEMIDQHQQVLIVAEQRAGSVPWYHQAFEVFQETPFDVRNVKSFSCDPWRGGTKGPLFQLNQWITRVPAPRPSDADLVNSHDFLMRRVRTCMRERGKLPNLIAVDFYRTGDLFEVAEELNRGRLP
jgi:hypothetical protein